MPAVMSEIATIKSFFDSHQVPLSNEWLESCVNWCKSENLGANYTITELQYKIYEQWLLLDLRDVELPSLPRGLSDYTKFVLTGNYSVQIMQIVDISKPKLWQLDKIRNSNALKNNVELDKTEPDTGKRVLLITFTDGVQEVEGMEYKPVPSLNLNSRPGLKVRLMGPITVRRGRLMLEEKNVKVLGGEVEEIVVSNAAENVLARALKLPENPNPFVIDESMLTANTDMFTQNTQASFMSALQRNMENAKNTNNQNSRNLNNQGSRNVNNQSSRNVNNQSSKSVSNHVVRQNEVNEEEWEEMKIEAEIDMLMEVENEVLGSKVTARKKSSTPDLFDDDFEDINEEELIMKAENSTGSTTRYENEPTLRMGSTRGESTSRFESTSRNQSVNSNQSTIKHQSTIISEPISKQSTIRPQSTIKSEPTLPLSQNTSQSIKESITENFDDLNELCDDVFGDFNLDVHLEVPKNLSIKELQDLLQKKKFGDYKVKGKFGSIVQKLTVVEEQLYLVIKIEDSTGTIDVRLHSDIIAGFAGYTPAEFMGLKSNVINKDENATHKVIKALKDIREQLIKLDGVFEIKLEASENIPLLIKIL